MKVIPVIIPVLGTVSKGFLLWLMAHNLLCNPTKGLHIGICENCRVHAEYRRMWIATRRSTNAPAK